MRKDKSDAPMSAINVVLDNDDKAREKGMKLLEAASAVASAANVQMQTKVRLATNLANGIIHSMKEKRLFRTGGRLTHAEFPFRVVFSGRC